MVFEGSDLNISKCWLVKSICGPEQGAEGYLKIASRTGTTAAEMLRRPAVPLCELMDGGNEELEDSIARGILSSH